MIEVILTSTVVSTVLSLAIAYVNNRSNQKIEHKKQLAKIVEYRYITLHEYLAKVASIRVDYNINEEGALKETVSKATDKFLSHTECFILAKPLIDSDIISDLEQSYNKCNKLASDLTSQLYGEDKTKESHKITLNNLLSERVSFESKFIEVLQLQISRLTK